MQIIKQLLIVFKCKLKDNLSSPASQKEASFSDVKMQVLTDEHTSEGLSFLILQKFGISEKTIYYKFMCFCNNCILFVFLKPTILPFLPKCWMETFWNITYVEENKSAVKERKNWMYSLILCLWQILICTLF